ncbi:hypothetical protein [Tuwongella immobilis]|uniref:Transposase: Marine sediment metagenome DNA, contig: S01H1_S14650 n=1 Tax=Tuwongella immobilis TaxID=692036 RepID=A0A6C2YQT0_9BACT
MRYRAEGKDHLWCWDLIHDRTASGTSLKVLSVVDEYTRDCLALEVKRSIGSREVIGVPDRRRAKDDEVLIAFLRLLKAEAGDDAVKLLTVKMDDDLSQRDVIRYPEFRDMGEWRIRRLMGRIRDAARAFAEFQDDDAILAAINRLTRTDEWAGGRGKAYFRAGALHFYHSPSPRPRFTPCLAAARPGRASRLHLPCGRCGLRNSNKTYSWAVRR